MRRLPILPSRCCRAVILALALSSFSSAENGASAVDSSVVVLRSGGVLHGQVSVSGERYIVTRPNSVVDVPAPQVLLVAHSMDDAYARQRQQLPRDTPEAHRTLAEWCLRYELLEPAKQELADARRLDPRDPRIALLERRLAMLVESKQARQRVAAAKPFDDAALKEELRELESMSNELPPHAVERFARKVQPLVVNSCTASGCHQVGGKQDFQLDRAVLHGLSNRRITLRNLNAILELVDRDSPQRSELLSISRRVHGGLERPILGPRHETQYSQLKDWVALVSQAETTKRPANFTPAVAAPPIEPMQPFGFAEEIPPSAYLDHNVASASAEEQEPPTLKKREVKFGADLRPWQPKDEFDPEVFNRLTAKTTSAEAATAMGGASQ